MKRRVVVIGCGWAGQHHARTVAESEYAELVALVEPDEGRAAEMRTRYGLPVHASVESALADEAFDTAIVATLPTLHYEQCVQLIEAGKDILCEKPLCRSVKEIAALKALSDERGLRMGVVFNQRYGKAIRKAVELLREDPTPRHLITASMYQDFRKIPGGAVNERFLLTDSCCHLLDLMTCLVGPADSGQAVGTRNAYGVYTDVAATLRFRSGCVGTLTHSAYGGSLDTQHPFQQIDVHTEKARYSIESGVSALTVYPNGSAFREVYVPSAFEPRDYGATMREACEAFLRALCLGEPLPATVDDALDNMAIIEELSTSML